VQITEATNVGSVPFYLLFEPQVVHIEEVAEGNFLNRDGTPTAFMSSVDNQQGRLIIGLSRLGAEKGISGAGDLVFITFTGIAPGTSPLHFDRASVRDPQAQPLPAEFRDGAITVH